MNSSFKKQWILYSLLVAIFTSCTQEDLTDCPPKLVKVRYEYTLNKEHTDLFGSSVKRMAVYIFDKDKLFQDSMIVDDTKNLGANQLLQLPLVPGEYTLVTCGGTLDTYDINQLIKGVTTLDDFRLQTQQRQANVKKGVATISQLSDLYWGTLTNLTVANTSKSVEQTVPLIKMTNTIKVNITHVTSRSPEEVSPLNVYCTGYNGQHIWNGTPHENAYQLKYLSEQTNVSTSKVEAEMKILRLMKEYDVNKPTVLSIEDASTENIIYEINIIDQLLKLQDRNGNLLFKTQEDLDREDTYIFDIQINDKDNKLSISVQVNGWITEVIDKPFI